MESTVSARRLADAQRAQAGQAELVAHVTRALHADGHLEPLPGLHLFRAGAPSEPLHSALSPALCIIAQGSKRVLLGADRYQYDPAHYLLATVELPIVSQVIEASPGKPYLSLRLDLDPTLVGEVMMEAEPVAARGPANARALDVSALDANLLDAVVRLARLLEAPTEARFMAPLITREILYRLLVGAQGNRLRHIAAEGGNAHRIVRAIARLRTEYDQPLRIDDLAREVDMSVSGFHHHFKAITGMSPLQFQKRQRLQAARLLLLGEHLDAASTAARVGYDDASHFNREYKRLFGLPPLRDVERLRAATYTNLESA